MFVTIGIHHPKQSSESTLLELMRKFGEAHRKHRGLIFVTAFKDETAGAVVGPAIWDRKEDFLAAREDLAKVGQSVDFESLETKPHEVYAGEPVVWV